MAMMDVGADRLWVDDSGGEGPVVVLLHPGIHDSTVWDPVLPLLDGLRTIRFDMRAIGQSPPATEKYRTVDDLRAVLDHAGVQRAHLVGNSMGGEAALALAVEHPERVASLTLLAPGIGGYPWPEPSEEDAALQEEFERLSAAHDVAGLAELLGRVWCAAGVDDSIRHQLVQTTEAEENSETFGEPNPEQWSRVDAIAVPVSVVVGGLDAADATRAGEDLAARIPGAELVRIERADHLLGMRDPDQVARTIKATVARA